MPVGFIQKDTEDFLINEKITFLLLNSIAELLKDNDSIGFILNKNNMEVISYFIDLVSIKNRNLIRIFKSLFKNEMSIKQKHLKEIIDVLLLLYEV